MFKKFLSPTDPSGGDPKDPSQEPDPQPDYKSKYEALIAQHNEDLRKAEERRAGLQSTFTKEQQAHIATRDMMTDLQEKVQKFIADKDAVVTKASNLETEKAQKEAKIAELELKITRHNLIFEKYLPLAPLEAKGLLPEAAPDKLDEVFGNFLTEINTIKASGKQENNAGGTPPPPAPKSQDPAGKTELKAKMFEAMRNGDTKEYTNLFDQLVKLE